MGGTFRFRIKPIPFSILLYFMGWLDCNNNSSNSISIGHFFMLISVWIMISWLVRIRLLKNSCNNRDHFYPKYYRKFAAIGLIFIPLYTLIFWLYKIKY